MLTKGHSAGLVPADMNKAFIVAMAILLVMFINNQAVATDTKITHESETTTETDKDTTKTTKPAESAKNAPEAKPKATPTYKVTGNKATWLRQSNIPESQWEYVDYIITRESGWKPCAYYPAKNNCELTAQQVNATRSTNSVACGLAQQKPCGKWSGDWRDPVNTLNNQYNYVKNRYGSYQNAVEFWKVNHWY